jgi:uncharacterized membrane protein YeaQ/YmgE (transglycosylase-associated protein family)
MARHPDYGWSGRPDAQSCGGLVGAIVGGFLFEKLKLEVVPDFWGNLITATVGAVVFLLIWRAIRTA